MWPAEHTNNNLTYRIFSQLYNIMTHDDHKIFTQIIHVPDYIFVLEEHVFCLRFEMIREAVNVTFIQHVQHQDAGHPEDNISYLL